MVFFSFGISTNFPRLFFEFSAKSDESNSSKDLFFVENKRFARSCKVLKWRKISFVVLSPNDFTLHISIPVLKVPISIDRVRRTLIPNWERKSSFQSMIIFVLPLLTKRHWDRVELHFSPKLRRFLSERRWNFRRKNERERENITGHPGKMPCSHFNSNSCRTWFNSLSMLNKGLHRLRKSNKYGYKYSERYWRYSWVFNSLEISKRRSKVFR